MNFASFVVAGVLVVLVVLAIMHIRKKGSCGCECGDCSSNGSCSMCNTIDIGEIEKEISRADANDK